MAESSAQDMLICLNDAILDLAQLMETGACGPSGPVARFPVDGASKFGAELVPILNQPGTALTALVWTRSEKIATTNATFEQ